MCDLVAFAGKQCLQRSSPRDFNQRLSRFDTRHEEKPIFPLAIRILACSSARSTLAAPRTVNVRCRISSHRSDSLPWLDKVGLAQRSDPHSRCSQSLTRFCHRMGIREALFGALRPSQLDLAVTVQVARRISYISESGFIIRQPSLRKPDIGMRFIQNTSPRKVTPPRIPTTTPCGNARRGRTPHIKTKVRTSATTPPEKIMRRTVRD